MSEFKHDFIGASQAQWEEQVKKDLKSSDIDHILQQALTNDIIQSPYSDNTTLPGDHWTTRFRNQHLNSENEWQGARYWLNIERLEGAQNKQLNKLALTALQGGAEGVEFVTADGNWDTLLEDLSLAHCYLAYQGNMADCNSLVRHINQTQLLAGHSLDKLAELTAQLKNQNLRCLTLYETSGHGNQLRHTAMLICKGIHIINAMLDKGLDPSLIARKLHFEVLMGDQYLWEICRLRVIRITLSQILRQYGVAEEDSVVTIGARTQLGAGTTNNIELQMLHNTTQSMAAVLGGCNLLMVRPHEEGFNSQDGHQRRIARNVGLLLRDESYLNRVGDAIAGSYYLESLMDNIAQSSWQQVQEIEAGGGFIKYKQRHEA